MHAGAGTGDGGTMTGTPWDFDELFDSGPMVVIRTIVPAGRTELDAVNARADLRQNQDSRLAMTPNSREVLGFTATEVPTLGDWVARIHPDDRQGVASQTRATAASSSLGTRLRYRIRRGDGTYRWVETLGTIRRGPPDEILAFVSDVTAEHEEAEQLRLRERCLTGMFDGAPAQIYVKDLEGRYLLCNADVLGLWGLHTDDVVGRTDHDLWPEFADKYRANDRRVVEVAGPMVADEEVTIDGELHTYLSLKFPIRDEGGEIYATAGVSADISDRANDLRALRVARDAAERANAAKGEFLSRMSHELRTPLNSVLGFAQLLELDELDERQSEKVAHILTAGRHLLDLINDVLDISRIEAGRLPVSIEPVDIAETIQSAIDLVRPAASESSISLEVRDPVATCFVAADRHRVFQVLLNLLSNAIKYNRPGGSVIITTDTSRAGRARIAVIDTGRGILDEHRDEVFEPFMRPGTDDERIEGSGVGLALCRSLVELMHGTIGLDSSPGVGSTFWFELPSTDSQLTVAPVSDHPAEREPDQHSSCILYVEDNPANVELVDQVLQLRPGAHLVTTALGAEACDLAREHDPALILLDLHLPDIDGSEVLARLRADPALGDIPTYVLTADATPARREELLAAGASGYLTKPIDVRALQDVISRAAEERRLERGRGPRPAPPTG